MRIIVSAGVIVWFIIGWSAAILRNEHGYWRAQMFGAMGPFALRDWGRKRRG